MKKIFHLVSICTFTISCKKNTPREAVSASETYETQKAPTATLLSETLDLPACESVVYDATHNRIYASMIGDREPGDGGVATIKV